MTQIHHARILLATAALTLLLMGCTEGTRGIFAQIGAEVETSTNDLPDAATTGFAITGIAVAGGAQERYVARTGMNVYTRLDTTGNWRKLALPGGLNAIYLAGTTNTVLVAASSNMVTFQLLSLRNDLSWEAVDTGVWNANTDGRVTGMATLGNDFFLSHVAGGADTGTLLRLENGTTRTDLGDFSSGLRDVASEGGETVFIGARDVAPASTVLATVTTTLASVGTAISLEDVPQPLGVGVIQATTSEGGALTAHLAIATGEGKVFLRNGSTWKEVNGQDNRAFSDVLWIDGRNRAIVTTISQAGDDGASGRGYYEAEGFGTWSGAPEVNYIGGDDIGSSYNGSALIETGIERTFYSSVTKTLFLLTPQGVWRSVYPDNQSTEPLWVWE